MARRRTVRYQGASRRPLEPGARETSMYEPSLHRQDDLAALHALIRRRPLGLIVNRGPQGLAANTIPFLLDAKVGHFGRLRAHVARANNLWRELQSEGETLVVFQDVDHYISPSWYATKRETGKVVPTWNYVMVQARGRAKAIEDEAWLRRQIAELTAAHEGGRAAPWAVDDAPEDFVAAMARQIVGLEIEIDDLRGKWKASQNRPAADRAGVIAGLTEDGDPDALAMAAIVREAMK
jgi:transcriptional regulator